uniref:Uncharacterized protein n=1 Tax=Switchgrass tombus-like virus 1 TaxID=3233122 RepID=A0AAU8MFU2_9TOMB
MPVLKPTRVNGKKKMVVVDTIIPPPPAERMPQIKDMPRGKPRAFKPKAKPLAQASASKEKSNETVAKAVDKPKTKRLSGAARRRLKRERAKADLPAPAKDQTEPATYAQVAKGVKGTGKSPNHDHPWVTPTGARYCTVQGCGRFIKPDVLVKYSPKHPRSPSTAVKTVTPPVQKEAEKPIESTGLAKNSIYGSIMSRIDKLVAECDAELTRDVTGPVCTKHIGDYTTGPVAIVAASDREAEDVGLLQSGGPVIDTVRRIQSTVRSAVPRPNVPPPPVPSAGGRASPDSARDRSADVWAVVRYVPPINYMPPGVNREQAVVPHNGERAVAPRIEPVVAEIVDREVRGLSPSSRQAVVETLPTNLPPPVNNIVTNYTQPMHSSGVVIEESQENGDDGVSILTVANGDSLIDIQYARRSRKGAKVYEKAILNIDRDLYFEARKNRLLTGRSRNDERFLKTQLIRWISENRKEWKSEMVFTQLAKVITATTVRGEFEHMQMGFLSKTDAMDQTAKAHQLNTVGKISSRRRRVLFWKRKEYNLPVNGQL